MKYGRLEVLETIRHVGRRTLAVCRCECGTEKTAMLYQLVAGNVKSCGCLKRERIRALGLAQRRHGGSVVNDRAPEYRSWEGMRSRCRNPNDSCFVYYGARGIRVSERWEAFEPFLADMGPRPRGTTLDRIDVNGNYGPDNCRWATSSTQARNKRNNRIVEYEGRPLTMVKLSEVTGVPYQRLHERIVRRGWGVERAIHETPLGW